MKHTKLNTLSVVLAILSTLTLMLWARSFHTADGILWANTEHVFSATSNRGCLVLRHDTLNFVFRSAYKGWKVAHAPASAGPPRGGGPGLRWDYQLLGFQSAANSGAAIKTGQYTGNWWPAYWLIGVPHPAVALLLAIVSITGFRYARAIRMGPTFCANCGYDLRATPERCPECGRDVKTSFRTLS